MNKKTGIIVAVCMAAVIIIGGAVWYFATDNKNTETPKNAQSVSKDLQTAGTNDEKANQTPVAGENAAQQPTEGSAPVSTPEPKKVKPTFVYFVSNEDMAGEEVPKVIADLQAEYGDRVVFDIRNVDETGDDVGVTPTLMMHDTHNNVCQWLPQNANKNDLKEAIEMAFQS